mmetsp:Transcript_66104/g.138073  ORF Transcript_66104/g.138073 Transcript_66104/m.138073 type:complete len:424 (-) Transcript_66104:66-1337(-)|eukprot:CAMPEP_0206422746 /NCGR_PEP_ID=MMETSP0324_2-20121206/2274_1 /ASSEMBLY_ACC=CAM_ASM_000836 /TAXON_ID=2866 /ORGANISM="Crypthecodinium cohnii, Strain Seligo" /LENGTH=423 /DNA_ID=CAMNT_0053887185 /DNA_START=91 /DNA_END=1362 /DNA_ORIENTATION=-
MDPSEIDRYCPIDKLVGLCSAGDVEGVQKMIDRSLNKCGRQATWQQITSCDSGERGSTSALHTAAVRGRASILKIFLEAEVNPNATDDAGCGPVLHTFELGHPRAAYVLLKGGANPDLRNNFGKAPRAFLELNSWESKETKLGKVQIQQLLEDGIESIDYEDLRAEPEGHAVKGDDKEGMQMQSTASTMTSGTLSSIMSRQSTVSKTFSGASAQSSVRTALGVVRRGPEAVVESNAPMGVSQSEQLRRPRGGGQVPKPQHPTALGCALSESVRRNDVEEVRRRLEAARKEGGRVYAIQEACNREEDCEDARIIPSPMHVAAIWGHLECLKVLLDTGASVDHATDAGDTLLHIAASYGQQEVVDFLLKNGADMHARNNFGRTAIELAREETFDNRDMRLRKAAVRQLLRTAAAEDPIMGHSTTL